MMRVATLVVALAAAPVALCGSTKNEDASVPAVQKVIQLLNDMKQAAIDAKNKEAVDFSKFKQFCLDTARIKENDIKSGKQLIESLSADIEKLDADIADLQTKIDEHQQTIETSEADLKAAKAQRDEDKNNNAESIQDFADSVDALERAIATLQKQNIDRPQQEQEALIQLSSPEGGMPETVQRTLEAFMQLHNSEPVNEYLTRDAPEANAYEFQSGGVVTMLQKLRDDFISKRSEAEKEEMNSHHAYNMISQDLHDQIEGAKADTADKTAQMNEKQQESASKKKRLASAKADLEEDTKYLNDLKIECDEKGHSFAEKQNLRSEEIKAITSAMEILSSDDVLGAAQKHLPAALLAKGSALSHLRSDPNGASWAQESAEGDTRRMLTTFLSSQGRRLHSNQLAMLAQRIASSGDPFAKVKKLIEDMIKQLLREAGEESEHKGWCDTELGTNKQTRTRLNDEVDALTAKVEETEAMITETTQRLAALAKEIEELQSAKKEATELRTAEKKKNEATIQDANEAQKAVQAAVAILRDFYEKAGQATAFVQVFSAKGPFDLRQPEVKMGSEEWNELANPNADEVDRGHKAGMQTFGKTYTGRQDEAGGVLAMLEVIQSDFSTLQADTGAAEAQAANNHRKFMAESEKSVAVKTKETDMLTTDRAQAEANLATDKKDLAATQDELLAANRYYDKLKPVCVDSGMSYEQRAKAREEEIQSLQEALRILSGSDIA